MKLKKNQIDKIIKTALAEDRFKEDITSRSIEFKAKILKASIFSRQDAVVCGLDICCRVFKMVDSAVVTRALFKDGDVISGGSPVFEISAPPESVFKGERTALNFLSHLSGIATLTRKFVDKSRGVPVFDTRKTVPGLRVLEKYAVAAAGGKNHRTDLASQVLVKENHIRAAEEKNLKKLIDRIRLNIPDGIKIEVEVENISQLNQALDSDADIIMLDNFSPSLAGEAKKIAALKRPEIKLEISGGISLDNIDSYAGSGADRISVGSLTNAAPPVDFTLLANE